MSLCRIWKQWVVSDSCRSRSLCCNGIVCCAPVFVRLPRRANCAQGHMVQRGTGRWPVDSGWTLTPSYISKPVWISWWPAARLSAGSEWAAGEWLWLLLLQVWHRHLWVAQQEIDLSDCYRFIFYIYRLCCLVRHCVNTFLSFILLVRRLQMWRPGCNPPKWKQKAKWLSNAWRRATTPESFGSKMESHYLNLSSRLDHRILGIMHVHLKVRIRLGRTQWH